MSSLQLATVQRQSSMRNPTPQAWWMHQHPTEMLGETTQLNIGLGQMLLGKMWLGENDVTGRTMRLIIIIIIIINFIVSNREISINGRRSASAQLAKPKIEPRAFQLLSRRSIHYSNPAANRWRQKRRGCSDRNSDSNETDGCST
jgi:hypothetical protein